MNRQHRLAFIATNGTWGGSEELWSQTAAMLARNGGRVSAKVPGWQPMPQRVLDLRETGVAVHVAQNTNTFWRRAVCKAVGHQNTRQFDVDAFLRQTKPDLIVISTGGALPPIEVVELCVARGLPFVCIGQANYEGWWPEDSVAARYRKALPMAKRCYFVCEANRRLVERQIGTNLPNAEILRNPFNVPFDAALPWPSENDDGLRLACVGRLHPPSKGQDILLEALAASPWDARKWRLTFYGEGPCGNSLRRLSARLGLATHPERSLPDLADRVIFAGFAESIQEVWRSNHALVMPSRFEGLPLTIVEAMLCGRPVIATDVAGHSEIIEDGTTGFLAKAATVDAFRSALEQAWQRRSDLQQMGKLAAERIRHLVPSDPIEVFSEKIMTIARGT